MDIRLPVVVDTHINKFSGGTITELESGIYNGVIENRQGIPYLTQRPSFDIFEDAGTHVADARGRGIYYWEDGSALYIVNNDNLYKASQSTSISSALTAGTKKCYFFVLGTLLILVNPENSEAFTINTGDTVTEITDTDFPPKDTPSKNLAAGGAVLDQYLFVMTTEGVIHNSALSDPETWGALDFITAEIEEDGGKYLGKHHNHLAAMGVSTIEFFYNARNITGSPLARREDVSFNIGCASGESVWEEGDRLFFVGTNYSGALGAYVIENFQIRKISNTTIDSLLTESIARNSYSAVGSGMSGQGHTYYALTLYTTPSDVDPETTLVFDDTAGLWYEWETTINDIVKFPLVSWTKRLGDTVRYGEGILSNGDLISLKDNRSPQDTLLGSVYVVADYVDTGYVEESSDNGTAFTMKLRTGMYDGGTNRYKYPESLRFVGDRTPNSQTLTIKWANENNDSFNTGRSQDTSINSKEHRLGRFQRRNHELEYTATDLLRLEGLEMVLGVGNN